MCERLTGLLAGLLFITVLATPQATAQNAGTIRGSVTDPSAAVIPGATIQIAGNGISRTVKSDAQGRYTLALPPGTYAVKADAKGFVTFSQPAFNVSAGQVNPLDIALQIATETQEIQVNDETAGQAVSTSIRRRMSAHSCLRMRISTRCRTIRTTCRLT